MSFPHHPTWSSSSSSFPGKGYVLNSGNHDIAVPSITSATTSSTVILAKKTSSISREDEEAILRALAEDDNVGFAAALQEFPDSSFTFPPLSSSSEVSKERGSGPKSLPRSLVDPEWDTIDPNPNIYALFTQFNKEYFWDKLKSVEVKWSDKMTLCAGVCRYEKRAGFCSIGLSQALLKFRPRKDLIETLLHEMIHAYLFVTDDDRDRDGHGPKFHEHMYRINKQTGTKISVYHSFHDEVDHYRQHIWRCEGQCRTQKPYFGYVKRAMNRVPSKNDTWWADHQAKCGGQFVKIHEPDGFGEKKKNKRKATGSQNASPTQLPSSQPTLEKFKGFTSPIKAKPKPKPVDVSTLGSSLPKTPLKLQTVLGRQISQQSLSGKSQSAIVVDRVTPPIKKAKAVIEISSAKTAAKRQLNLDGFIKRSAGSSQYLVMNSSQSSSEVILLD